MESLGRKVLFAVLRVFKVIYLWVLRLPLKKQPWELLLESVMQAECGVERLMVALLRL